MNINTRIWNKDFVNAFLAQPTSVVLILVIFLLILVISFCLLRRIPKIFKVGFRQVTNDLLALVIISIGINFFIYQLGIEAWKLSGFEPWGPGLKALGLWFCNTIIGLYCFSVIISEDKLLEYLWIFIYFVGSIIWSFLFLF